MLIGIGGFAGSGKDTVANFIIEEFGYQKISFADSLKDACAILFGWKRSLLEGDTSESREWRQEVDEWWAEKLDDESFTPRLALQKFGTEAMREVFHQNFWTAVTERKILENPGNYVIADMRFANEVAMVNRMRGFTMRVKRGGDPEWWSVAEEYNAARKCHSSVLKPSILNNIHESEWAWIGQKFNYTIENDDSLDELKEKVKNLVVNHLETNQPPTLTNQ